MFFLWCVFLSVSAMRLTPLGYYLGKEVGREVGFNYRFLLRLSETVSPETKIVSFVDDMYVLW